MKKCVLDLRAKKPENQQTIYSKETQKYIQLVEIQNSILLFCKHTEMAFKHMVNKQLQIIINGYNKAICHIIYRFNEKIDMYIMPELKAEYQNTIEIVCKEENKLYYPLNQHYSMDEVVWNIGDRLKYAAEHIQTILDLNGIDKKVYFYINQFCTVDIGWMRRPDGPINPIYWEAGIVWADEGRTEALIRRCIRLK